MILFLDGVTESMSKIETKVIQRKNMQFSDLPHFQTMYRDYHLKKGNYKFSLSIESLL